MRGLPAYLPGGTSAASSARPAAFPYTWRMRGSWLHASALALGSAVFAWGCGARSLPPATPRGVGPPGVAPPVAAAPAPPPAPVPPWSDAAPPAPLREVLATAVRLVGTPYRDGGADPGGFDCSGFVQYVFGRHGRRVPRTVSDQFTAGRPVPAGEVRAGDLLFFATLGDGPTHVAIALAGGRFVHAPSGRGRVRIERFDGRYWPPRFVGARRLEGDR